MTDTFSIFAKFVQDNFDTALMLGGGKLFRTAGAPDELVDAYLGAFASPDDRQYHNCSCCKHFINHFGGLVYLDKDGRRISAMWGGDTPPRDLGLAYSLAAARLQNVVSRRDICGTFHTKHGRLGEAFAGGFEHFSVAVPSAHRHSRRDMTAGQFMALQRERHGMLIGALQSFTQPTFTAAAALLGSGQLKRGDQFQGQAAKLASLRGNMNGQSLWHAVAYEAEGFCHVKSGVLGSLLEDIQQGLPAADIKARFEARVAPDVYRRPTAAPKAGAIDQAEKMVDDLGLRPSLARRQMAISEAMPPVWSPVSPVKKGTFGHLRQPAPGVPATALPRALPTSWVTFLDKYLVNAEAVHLVLGDGSQLFSFGGFTEAVDPFSPPILAWDKESERNTAGWYRWPSAQAKKDFGLSGEVAVRAVFGLPARCLPWEGVCLALEGARDAHLAQASTGIYPEGLRPDLQSVSRVLTMHSRQDRLQEVPDPVVGLFVRPAAPFGFTLKVTTAGVSSLYTIDRWE